MSLPNPELYQALLNSPPSFDWKEYLEEKMKSAASAIPKDSFALRAVQYSRQNYTVALLLAFDSVLRDDCRSAGIDVREFDNIVGQAQQFILTKTQPKVTPANKMVQVLRKLTGI